MDRTWLYLGSIVVGVAVLIYIAISFVSSANPPVSDLRLAYEKNK